MDTTTLVIVGVIALLVILMLAALGGRSRRVARPGCGRVFRAEVGGWPGTAARTFCCAGHAQRDTRGRGPEYRPPDRVTYARLTFSAPTT